MDWGMAATMVMAAAALITSMGALALGLFKGMAEKNKLEAEAGNSQAEAVESWATSSKIAASQVIEMQKALAVERLKRLDLHRDFEALQEEMEEVREEMGKKIAGLEIEIENLRGRINRLEGQVVSLGAEPVE